MSEQTKPKWGVMVQATSLMVALLMYTTSMTTPALAAIAAAFPDASGETIKLISSIPSLMLCIFSLVSGWMTTKLSIKKCIIIAACLIFVGILPAFFGSSLTFVIATRVVFGAGYGLIFPLASAVITDLYEGAKKDTMMGWKSAIGAAAGVVFQTMGGMLVAYNWQYAFLGFLLVIPILVFVIIFLPDTGVQAAKGKKEGSLTPRLAILAVVGFCLNVVQFSYMQDMTFVITGEEIGTALDAANILSMFTAFSFIAGLIYVVFAKIMKKYTPAIAILFVGIAFFIALNAHSVPMFFVASAIFGLGFGFTNPSLTLLAASSVTHPSKSPVAISIYVCATGVGQFLCAYILKFIKGALGLTANRADWQIASASIITGVVIGLICLTVFGGKKKERG